MNEERIKYIAQAIEPYFSELKEHLQKDLIVNIMKKDDAYIKECKIKYNYLDQISTMLTNYKEEE